MICSALATRQSPRQMSRRGCSAMPEALLPRLHALCKSQSIVAGALLFCSRRRGRGALPRTVGSDVPAPAATLRAAAAVAPLRSRSDRRRHGAAGRHARSADAIADVASKLWTLSKARFEGLAGADAPLYAALRTGGPAAQHHRAAGRALLKHALSARPGCAAASPRLA